jgi:hypothetical protein
MSAIMTRSWTAAIGRRLGLVVLLVAAVSGCGGGRQGDASGNGPIEEVWYVVEDGPMEMEGSDRVTSSLWLRFADRIRVKISSPDEPMDVSVYQEVDGKRIVMGERKVARSFELEAAAPAESFVRVDILPLGIEKRAVHIKTETRLLESFVRSEFRGVPRMESKFHSGAQLSIEGLNKPERFELSFTATSDVVPLPLRARMTYELFNQDGKSVGKGTVRHNSFGTGRPVQCRIRDVGILAASRVVLGD